MTDISTSASEYSISNLSSTKLMLLKLFLYYSSLGERSKVGILSPSNYLQLLRDSKIISEPFSTESADVLIRKSLKQKKFFSFESFCDSLVDLSESFFLSDQYTSKSEILIKLLSTHILPLYSTLLSQNSIINLELSLTPPLLQIISSVKSYFLGLYKLYFPWEINSAQNPESLQKLSEKSLFTLISKYKVFPDIINRQLFTMLWQNLSVCPPEFIHLISLESIGKMLTFAKFVSFFILASAFGNFKSSVAPLHEKFLGLLENMEICSGNNEIPSGNVIFSKSTSSTASPKNYLKKENANLEKLYYFVKFSGVNKEITVAKLKYMLKNSAIAFEPIQIEIIFRSLSKISNEFERFCEFLSKINEFLVNEDQSQKKVSEKIMESDWYLSISRKIAEFLDRINSDELSEALEIWKSTLIPFLKHYTYKGKLGFQHLLSFVTDFGLFPELIPKQRLDEMFYLFCIEERSEELEVSTIICILEICAVEAFIPNLNDHQKLTSVLERILHSEGHAKIIEKTGINRKNEIAEAGNKFYEKKNSISRTIEKINFDGVFNNSPSPKKNK